MHDGAICPHAAACAVIRSSPNIFLITLYGLLILFWAQVTAHMPEIQLLIASVLAVELHNHRFAVPAVTACVPEHECAVIHRLHLHRVFFLLFQPPRALRQAVVS